MRQSSAILIFSEFTSVNDYLRKWFKPEEIHGWKCPKCNTASNTTKEVSIVKSPDILFVFFKRFEWSTGAARKIKGEVTVPFDEIDLTPFMHPVFKSKDKPTFKMIAHIDHQGDLNSGHYTA